MKNIDDLEWEKWDVIRRKGRFVYILKWILYSIGFALFTQGTLLLINGKSISFNGVMIALLVYISLGLIISNIRWGILEKRYQRK